MTLTNDDLLSIRPLIDIFKEILIKYINFDGKNSFEHLQFIPATMR